MKTVLTPDVLPFLAGGGEMGALTRQLDWSATPLGPPSQWPQSLKTTVGLLLHSAFPMFLFWGPELICFYNDAYRPSLGDNGKHPAVGKRASEVWPEIWDFIGPLIDQVLTTGEPVFYQDQLVPIYRNGRLEDVYWTFSYSPAYDDDGQINGVFVTTYETTRTVNFINQLQLSDQRFQNLVREASVGIIILEGGALRVSVVNQAYARLIDRSPEELAGRELFSVIPEAEAVFRPIIDGVRLTGEPVYLYAQPYFVQVNGVRKDGVLDLVYQPYKEQDGQITGVMVLCQDVTEQVLARRKIEESEARFRSLIAESPVATCLFMGPDLVIEVANEEMIRFFGRGPSIMGKPVREVLTNTDGDSVAIALLEQVFSTGELFSARSAPASLTIDGVAGTYYFDLSLKPLRNEIGAVYAILQTATDVTEQVMARQKLEEAESGLRVAVELAQLGTWSIDVATKRLTYSERLIKWFGHDPAANDYNSVIPILETGDQERVAAAIARALDPQSDGIYNEIYTVIHPQTGKKRILHAQGKVICDATGKAVRLNGTAQDITIQRELQLALEQEVQQRIEELAAANEELAATNEELAATNEELTEANNLLLRSNDNLQQFAYVASHDLQEPLRKIQSFGDLLLNQHADQLGAGVNHLQRMQVAASRMSTLIRDLLTYSRISTRQEATQSVSLTPVVGQAITDLDLLIQDTGAEVRVDSLPVVSGDATQLGQLFQNLLSNALKFRRDKVPPVVHVCYQLVNAAELPPSVKPVRSVAAYYRIDVADNGIGFDDKYVDRIFQVFQRLHGRSQYVGTGIGLAICEKVATNHGGAITAVSQPGQGATFSLYLPA